MPTILTAADVSRLAVALKSRKAYVISLTPFGSGGSIPTGGSAGQVLEKNSSTSFDVGWSSLPSPPSPQISFGHGPPTGTPSTDPHIYIDLDAKSQYYYANGAWL